MKEGQRGRGGRDSGSGRETRECPWSGGAEVRCHEEEEEEEEEEVEIRGGEDRFGGRGVGVGVVEEEMVGV